MGKAGGLLVIPPLSLLLKPMRTSLVLLEWVQLADVKQAAGPQGFTGLSKDHIQVLNVLQDEAARNQVGLILNSATPG